MQLLGKALSAAAVVATLMAATACGGGGSDSGSTPPAGTPAPATSAGVPAAEGQPAANPVVVNPCTLLTASDFATQLGGGTFTFGEQTGPVGPSNVSGCTIVGENVPIGGKNVSTKIGVATSTDDASGTLWANEKALAAAFEGKGVVSDTLIQTAKSNYAARKGAEIVEITAESSGSTGFVNMTDDAAQKLAVLAQSRLP